MDIIKGKISIREKLTQGGSWALGGALCSSILGLGINGILARSLSASDLGIYFLLVSYVNLFAVLSQGGGLQVLLRRIALSPTVHGKRAAFREIKSACFYVSIWFVFVAAIVIIFFDLWVNAFVDQKTQLLSMDLLIVLWIALMAFQGIVTESYRGLNEIRSAVLFGGMVTNTILITTLGLLFVKGIEIQLLDVIIIVVGAALISMSCGMALMTKHIAAAESHSEKKNIEPFYIESIPLFFYGLLAMLLSQGDLWMVGILRGSEDAAIYAVAVKVAVLAGMPLNILNAVLPPFIVQLYKSQDLIKLEKLLRGSASIASVPALILVGVALFYGGELLALMFGDQFKVAAPIFSVLCVGQLIHVLLGSGGIVLMLTGHGPKLMRITLVSSTVLIVGCAIAAPYGIQGVAYSAALALVTQKMLLWKYVKSKLGVSIHAWIGIG